MIKVLRASEYLVLIRDLQNPNKPSVQMENESYRFPHFLFLLTYKSEAFDVLLFFRIGIYRILINP